MLHWLGENKETKHLGSIVRQRNNARHSMTCRRCRIVSLARRTRDANMSLPEAQDLYESIVVRDKGTVEGAAGHDILAAPESKSLSSCVAQITGTVGKELRFESEVRDEHASQVL